MFDIQHRTPKISTTKTHEGTKEDGERKKGKGGREKEDGKRKTGKEDGNKKPDGS